MPPSKQVNNLSLPAYMRRRGNMPAPVLGIPVVVSFGPIDAFGTTAGHNPFTFLIPGAARIMAVSLSGIQVAASSLPWSFVQTTHATSAATIRVTVDSATAAASFTATANFSTVIYFNDTSASYRVLANKGTTGGLVQTDPETPNPDLAAGTAAIGWQLRIDPVATNDYRAICGYIMYMPTKYQHTAASDD